MKSWLVRGNAKSNHRISNKLQNSSTSGSYWNTIGYSRLKQTENLKTIPILSEESSSDDDNKLKKYKIQMVTTKGTYNMRQEFENSYEELVESNSKIRRIRIALISGGALIACGLVILAVVLLMKSRESYEEPKQDRLILDDFISGHISPRRFNGSWISEREILYKDEKGNILSFDINTKLAKKAIPGHMPLMYEAFLYEKSPDNKYLLIAREHVKLFRYSFLAIYDIIDIETGEVLPIHISGETEQARLLFAKWSPEGNGLILNFKGNLYYKRSPNSPEIKLKQTESDKILNGHPDWVYEEEVFSSNTAVWFNPSGTKLAYISFNDASTKMLNIPYYGTPGNLQFQYPFEKVVSYPKAGSVNPLVKLYQVDLLKLIAGEDNQREILVPHQLNTEEHIITAVTWLTNDNLLSVWMNRIQNEAYLQVTNDIQRQETFSIESKTGWVDLFTPPIKNKDGSRIAFISPVAVGSDDSDNYRHLTVIQTNKFQNVINHPIYLTTGKYVVQQILNWDYETDLIFYTANTPMKSNILNLYAIKASSRSEKPHCLTCGIKFDGVEQTYFSADFSLGGRYIIISSLGPSIPRVDIYLWSLENNNIHLKHAFEWEKNNEIRETLKGKQLPIIEYQTIDIVDGFTANVLLLLPPDIDRSGSTKYPLLIDVYAGPDTYSAIDKFNMDWGSYLASNRSVICAKIDGRGSGLRGDKLLHSIYLNLGTYEVYDQINVTRKLQENNPFIDPERIGIWGWSYGGYASAMALALDENQVFKCGASVAPVTDWIYYDSIYTERYMGLPKDNLEGYAKSRLTSLAPKFRNKKYLLVHGTLDDNVHYQQAMVFAKALEYNDIMFKQISYPDEDHGLINVRPHLFHSLDRFFGDCFDLDKKTRT